MLIISYLAFGLVWFTYLPTKKRPDDRIHSVCLTVSVVAEAASSHIIPDDVKTVSSPNVEERVLTEILCIK